MKDKWYFTIILVIIWSDVFFHIKQPFQLHSQSSHNSSSRFIVVVNGAVVVVELWTLWVVVVEVVDVFVSSVETVVVGFGVGPVAKWTAVIMRATIVVTEVMKERVNSAIIRRRRFMFRKLILVSEDLDELTMKLLLPNNFGDCQILQESVNLAVNR